MATKKTVEVLEIQPIEMQQATLRLVGDSPLIMHAWSAKAKREMLSKQIGTTKTKAREPKNPVEDFVASMYWLTPMPTEFTDEAVGEALEHARFGFPVTAFKQAAISAAYRMGWAKDKMSMRGAFFLNSTADAYYGGDLVIGENKKIDIFPNRLISEPMIEIHSDPPLMREDMVKVGMGTADIRYRGEFRNWYADITIKFNRNGQYSLEQVVNIINAGGCVCGVGEWRPERDGQYGMFHVSTV